MGKKFFKRLGDGIVFVRLMLVQSLINETEFSMENSNRIFRIEEKLIFSGYLNKVLAKCKIHETLRVLVSLEHQGVFQNVCFHNFNSHKSRYPKRLFYYGSKN